MSSDTQRLMSGSNMLISEVFGFGGDIVSGYTHGTLSCESSKIGFIYSNFENPIKVFSAPWIGT